MTVKEKYYLQDYAEKTQDSLLQAKEALKKGMGQVVMMLRIADDETDTKYPTKAALSDMECMYTLAEQVYMNLEYVIDNMCDHDDDGYDG